MRSRQERRCRDTVAGVHVLFVCTGNICRSPTAERLAVAYAHEGGLDLTASSAGTHGLTGHAMDSTAAAVLHQLGGESSGFVARRVTPKITETADLILTMTARHRDDVLAIAPRKLRKTFTLLEAVALVSASGATTVDEIADARARTPVTDLDIEDPYRNSPDVYERIGQQIADALPAILRLS
jgi:protein-tyrosine phosphatase